VLSKPSSLESITRCFVTAKANSFENILDPLLKIVRSSSAVALGIAKPDFFQRLTDRLSHHKAVVRLNLLRLLKAVCDVHPDHASLVARFGLYDVVERLSRTDVAVLVRELAREILPILLPGGVSNALTSKTGLQRNASDRPGGAPSDLHSFDEVAQGRRILPIVQVPTFPPRTKVRRAASEASSSSVAPPAGPSASGSAQFALSNSFISESGTAKKVRPAQRRSVREVGGMLEGNGVPLSSMRSAISSSTSSSSGRSESKLVPRRTKSTLPDSISFG